MASFEEIMKKAPAYLSSKFNDDIANGFANYCQEEEMDTVELITDDLEVDDFSGSAIIESMAETFTLNDNDKEKLFKSLRILFGLEIGKVALPTEINWVNTTSEDISTAQNYINKQCNDIFNADKSLIQLIAIGRKNDINIVPLLFDIFSKYKFKIKMKKINNKTNKLEGATITHSEFCARSKFLKQLKTKDEEHKKIYNSLVQTLNSYQHRINPQYKGPGFNRIDDDINSFIEYTLCLSSMLKSVTDTNQSCLPLLVDAWIVPKKVKNAMQTDGDDDGSDSEDDDDSDDEDEDEKNESASINVPSSFEDNLKKFKIKFVSNDIDCKEPAKCIRVITQTFNKVLSQSRRSIKICIIIDRRGDGDKLLIYQLPLTYSAIPSNYCNETLIYSSASCFGHASTDKNIGGRDPMDGNMFLLSFSLHEDNKSRIQFWYNGGGLRFWPYYMIKIWPEIFENANVNAKYTKEYIEEKFALQVGDDLFTSWYNAIVDFDHDK